ncbi:MAG TPA: 3-dehydroquinate synthase, partial [Candidatus Eisenbacteria bacterium]|nr:3-dehydroquinate synthase [Candidatus Eisenbacteria bacterium]
RPHVVDVRSTARTYPVLIASGLRSDAGQVLRARLGTRGVLVVSDRTVTARHGARLRQTLRQAGIQIRHWSALPPGERSKTLSTVRGLYREWIKAGADRATVVLAFGGGVVGDVAGFAASTLFRGLPTVHVPTTVISQVDSAVGGKTGVNFEHAKNLIGTFHPPELVLIDPSLLDTLSERDFRAGWVEAVKMGVTLRRDLFERLERDHASVLRREPALLRDLVSLCVEAKSDVVSRDERDEDVRAILNYGHTVGHAVEAAYRGRLRHGEAVAVGMNAAAWLGEELGLSVGNVRERQNRLLGALGLKLVLPDADKSLVSRNLKLDKKVREKKTRFVLTLQVGSASVWPHISGRLLRTAVRVVTS